MQTWFPENLFIHAHLKKSRRLPIKTEVDLRRDAEEQALVKEVREAKMELEERLYELKTWRQTHLNAF